MLNILAIDKAKGIIAKPMPKQWYDRAANRITDDLSPEEAEMRKFNQRILADKKPYFMRYIYPDLMSKYNTYIKNTEKKCMREFRKTISELFSEDPNGLSEREAEFIKSYNNRMPVGTNQCVMNIICKKIESQFDGYFSKSRPPVQFDYSIMKSGNEYTTTQYRSIQKLYEQYLRKQKDLSQFNKKEKFDEDEMITKKATLIHDFKSECFKVCSNESQLCDVIIDVCYSKESSKQFCWDICGDVIIKNLLCNNDNKIIYPSLDDDGSIEFGGKRFSLKTKEIYID